MFETAGTLTVVELASSLVALVLLPLVWATVAAVAALRGAGERLASRFAVAASAGTLALAVVHGVRAAQLPPGHVAVQHVGQLARIGQLDLSLDLVRDPTSIALSLLVAFLAFAAALHAVWTTERTRTSWRLAWTGLAASATLLSALADGVSAFALGLSLATLAAWALAGGRFGRPLGVALAGDTTVVFAACVLFWSLGGTFGASGYTPDPLPRFALVALPDAPRPDGKTTVSLTTYDGASVSSDEGPPLPGEPLVSPFTVTLEPGSYSFQIEPGGATPELLVTHVTLAAGRAYVLTPYGPTASFRNLADQLAVPRPAPAGPVPMLTTLGWRVIGGVRVPTVIVLVMVVAMLVRLGFLARRQPGGGLGFAFEGVAPVALLLHVAPLCDPSSAAVIAVFPAAAAVILAADAAACRVRARVPRAALAALAALAIASILLGETAAALTILVAASLGAAAASAAIEVEADARWLGVACAGLAGILPGAGASPGVAAALGGAFGASAAGRWAGGVVAPLITIALILVAVATFRMVTARERAGPVVVTGRAATTNLVLGLALASTLAGAALGVGSSPFGGAVLPLSRRLVAPGGGLDGVPRTALAGFGLSVAAAAIGLLAARRAGRTLAPPSWIGLLGAPALLVERSARAGGSLLGFFVRAVTVMDEDVIDDVTEVAAAGLSQLGRGARRADAAVAGGPPARALGRSVDELVVRAGIDDPVRFERVRLAVLLGMVAILGLVVLSSVVLG